MLEESAPPGANYDKAEFRLWLPKNAAAIRAIVVLVPGSNGDGRGQAEDTVGTEDGLADAPRAALYAVCLEPDDLRCDR